MQASRPRGVAWEGKDGSPLHHRVEIIVSTLSILYHFTFPDGTEKHYPLHLDDDTLELIDHRPEHLPPWAELDYHKCPHCPLPSETVQYCPLASNLVPVVTEMRHILSYDDIHLRVTTRERTVSQKTTAQRALSSFMGVINAGSGCPHTVYFKPMARFHLPLASEAETIYRSTSMYLLAQYFRNRKTKDKFDFSLTGLDRIYRNIQIVNSFVVKRLRDATRADSHVNAIIILDMYARAIPEVIEDSLEEIRYLFSPFLGEGQEGDGSKR